MADRDQPFLDAVPAAGNAYGRLVSVDIETLTVEDLERLADAAFWLGRPSECIRARRRSYALHRDAGDTRLAARTAWLLFYDHYNLNETAAARGWLKRASDHANEVPGSVELGYVAAAETDWARYSGDLEKALSCAVRAADTGRVHEDRDLTALATALQGRILVHQGRISEGLELLDEAMLAAVANELAPFITGGVYCLLLVTCQGLGDIRRAGEWTDLAIRWCEDRGQHSWYPGLCRLHRCEVQSLRGEWAAAEREALRAAEELAPFGNYLVAESFYVAGEIRRHRGDFAGAEEAFLRANELGREPQPGLALLRLAEGGAEAAASMLRVALAGGAAGPLQHARLLLAQVEAELQTGNVGVAEESASRLLEIADETGVSLMQAMAARARGEVLLAAEQIDEALNSLRQASAICRELCCPYECAEARLLLGIAARRAGDQETAKLETEAARTEFERLGAMPAAQRAAALIAGEPKLPDGLTEREVQVLSLVARGRTNREVAESLFISEHTVARHLSNIFNKIDVTTRSAAAAFAFEHGLA